MSSNPTTPQQLFNDRYVSSREILQRLKITRPTISRAHQRGILPAPIIIHDTMIYLWERAVAEPYIAAWEFQLNAKRAHKQ